MGKCGAVSVARLHVAASRDLVAAEHLEPSRLAMRFGQQLMEGAAAGFEGEKARWAAVCEHEREHLRRQRQQHQ
jgi:hypothetical protein|tara:strand:- start:13 stop:234 length:222 start_codon:yes stop_codon:yes gene_type:complete